MNNKITLIKKHTDTRGDLIVFLKNKKVGQIYFVTFNRKGVIRGNHYHKKWREWCGIITGRIWVILKDIRNKEKNSFVLDSNKNPYLRIEIAPYIAHAFVSLTPSASLLNYADTEWSGKDDFDYKLI